ncbi:MAG: hypothetical protein ACM3ZT_08465 [Bacillota bacterium]
MRLRSCLVAVLLVLVAGCASAPKPAPAPLAKAAPAAVTKPKPAAPAQMPQPKPEAPRPSVAATSSIAFDGSSFTSKYHVADKGQVLTEYYLASETPDTWTRLVDLHVYPTAGQGIGPNDYAVLVSKRLVASNPSAHFLIYQNKVQGTAMLDFLTWNDADLKASRLEFNVFKFFLDPKTGNLISFHYAERVKVDPKASSADNGNKIKLVRQRIVPEVAAALLYRE